MSTICPYCNRSNGQVKAGMNAGNQRFKCTSCARRYTPDPRSRGYGGTIREQAIEMHDHGLPAVEIAKRLAISSGSVSNWIRHRLQTGTLAPAGSASGDAMLAAENAPHTKRRPTVHEVALRARVSVSTISNFLNKKGRMSDATSRRIQSAIDELNFTPNSLVRAIRQNRTNILGTVLFGLWSLDKRPGVSITPPILTGIDMAAEAAEYDVLLYTNWSGKARGLSFERLLGGHIDGVVWVAPGMHEPIMERVAAAGLPIVALLTRHVPDNVGYVDIDNLNGMRLIVEHLAAIGRRRLAYIGPAHSSDFIDRRDGYYQALLSLGLERCPDLEVAQPNAVDVWSEYQKVVGALLDKSNPPDAIVTADDGLAMLVVEAIQHRGRRVPQDIAVTGFNDISEARRFNGGLTTIRQDFRGIGHLGAERLVALIDGAPVDECRVTVKPKLMVRATTVVHP